MRITEFQLHAFVDGQLRTEEQTDILSRAAADTELAQRIASLQHLKQLLRHAYGEARPPERRRTRTASGKPLRD